MKQSTSSIERNIKRIKKGRGSSKLKTMAEIKPSMQRLEDKFQKIDQEDKEPENGKDV